MILKITNRGYGSVNVWGRIFGNEKTALVRLNGRVTGDVYVRDILAEQVQPFLRNRANGMLMQDNAPPHRASSFKVHISMYSTGRRCLQI